MAANSKIVSDPFITRGQPKKGALLLVGLFRSAFSRPGNAWLTGLVGLALLGCLAAPLNAKAEEEAGDKCPDTPIGRAVTVPTCDAGSYNVEKKCCPGGSGVGHMVVLQCDISGKDPTPVWILKSRGPDFRCPGAAVISPSAPVPNLKGTYTCTGTPCCPGGVGTIDQNGVDLTLDNGCKKPSSKATGTISGRTITVTGWPVTGAISVDDRTIKWDNDSQWDRR
jgi:hypothetical protein